MAMAYIEVLPYKSMMESCIVVYLYEGYHSCLRDHKVMVWLSVMYCLPVCEQEEDEYALILPSSV